MRRLHRTIADKRAKTKTHGLLVRVQGVTPHPVAFLVARAVRNLILDL